MKIKYLLNLLEELAAGFNGIIDVTMIILPGSMDEEQYIFRQRIA